MTQRQSTNGGAATREDLLQRTIESLHSVMRQMHRGVAPPELGLSPAQARLAFVIARCGDAGIAVTELARVSHVTPGAITQFADALTDKGVVTREEDPEDRRVVRLKLTPQARSGMRDFRRSFLASVAGAFDALSTEELQQLNDLLARVKVGTAPEDDDRNVC